MLARRAPRRATSGRSATSRSRSSRARRSASSAATARARRRCCGSSPGSSSRPPGSVEVGGRVGSLLELGAGFHPDFTGRENVYLNGSILRPASARRSASASTRSSRSPSSSEFIDRAGAHVLVGDVHAARLRDRRAPRRRRAAARRGVRGRRRGVPAQVLRQDLRVQAARRHDRLRLARRGRRSSGSASARCCCARARSRSTARRTRRSPRYHRCSPTSAIRPSAPPACASGGAARRGSPTCAAASAPDGEERQQFLAGEPLSLRLRIEAENGDRAAAAPARAARRGRPPRRRRTRSTPPSVGWDRGRGERAALRRRPAAARRRPLPPPARARRRERRRLYHWLDDALDFLVYPAGEERGRRPAGRELDRARRTREPSMSSRTCPDWPELMEIAPDLQFKHYTVAEAQLPAEASDDDRPRRRSATSRSAATSSTHVFYAEHTDPQVAEALRADALVRAARVRRRAGPGASAA